MTEPKQQPPSKIIRLDSYGITIVMSWTGTKMKAEVSAHSLPMPEPANYSQRAVLHCVLDLVCYHAEAGIDVTSPAYLYGIECLVENGV